MKMTKINSLGMELEQWELNSCTAQMGIGKDFATIFFIESKEQGKGHATELLTNLKEHYESLGKDFGSSVALSKGMKHLLKKLNITEYI